MRNPRQHRTRARAASGALSAAVALLAIATIPAAAGAATLTPAAQTSPMSLTFTGQTGTSSWSANPLTVTADASTTDSTNPIYETTCSVDQGAATTVLGAQEKVPVAGNGAHIVECYPTAWDGTQGTPAFTTVQIDDQIPTVVLAGATASPAWHTGSQTVTAQASEAEALSGIQSVTCLDGAGNTTVTPGTVGAITVSGTQRYSVSCYATTNSGVTGARTYEQIWMDNTAPVVTFVSAPDPTQWFNTGQSLVVDVQTPAAGAPIASLTCDYNGQPILPNGQLTEAAPAALHNWSVPVTLPGTDSGAASCFASDSAANVSSSIATSQKVDTEAPTGVFIKNPTNPDVIVAKVADALSGVYGATIQYQQNGKWATLPTTLHGDIAKAVIPANNPIKPGKHPLRIVVTDNADNTYDGSAYQSGQEAMLDYPVAAGLHLLYTITPSGKDLYGRPAQNTDANSTLRLAYRQRALIQGRLYSTARSLVAKQLVTIKVTIADHRSYVAHVHTNGQGQWSYRLLSGGNRTVKIAYAGSVGLAARSHTIRVINDAAVDLTAGPTNHAGHTRIVARVLGGPQPQQGLRVVVQWRRNTTAPWITFSHLPRANRAGILRTTIPVPTLAAGTHIQLRASVHATAGWGYDDATSRILDRAVAAA